MRILVTGGAGFIGSVITEQLVEAGHSVVVLDNFKSGHRAAIHPSAQVIDGDIELPSDLDRAFSESMPDAVCHLAGEIKVDESARNPGLHFRANVVGGIHLLDAMVRHNVCKLVFSSTAAVYGEPSSIPIVESDPTVPVNPYGETKLQFERALRWYAEIHGLHHVTLRYFNACGASMRYGEHRQQETHIIPILFEVALGQRHGFKLFGQDYPTKDGTCVRDYIHVVDIASAHILALDTMESLGSAIYNVGTGGGYSNLEVLEAAREVTGHPIPFEFAERRPGDSATLVASSDKIRKELGWEPKFPDLHSMVESAWLWRRNHPNGYSN